MNKMDSSKLHIVVVSGIIHKDGKILIIRRHKGEIAFPEKWEFPGGKVENKDSCRSTLIREIAEETSLKVKDNNIIYLGDYEFTRPDGFHVIGIDFLCEYKSGDVVISKDHTDFAWVTSKEAEKYDLIDGILERIKEVEKNLKGE